MGGGRGSECVIVQNSKAVKETSASLEQEFIVSSSLFMETPSSHRVYSIHFKVSGIVQVISNCLWNE